MTHFGSPERILAAGPEEFEGVPGVPSKTGRRIYEALHKAGGA
jgi:ERCC4-type nuclease